MSINSLLNSRRPDSAAEEPGGVVSWSQPKERSSLTTMPNVRGSAVSTMLNISTEAISSSSDICPSFAAATSSAAMEKATENDRSAPRLPMAPSAVADIAPPVPCGGGSMVHFSLVQDTTREAHYLPARLAWQSPSAGGALLVLRRLLCAPRSSGRSEGGPVRTVHKRSVHQTQHESDGTVFGCTLGNLMQHCRHTKNKYPLASSMGVLRRVLTGVSNTVGCSTGDDVETLVMGLGCHRVVKSQASRLPELKKCQHMRASHGHKATVLGATLSVLTAFECIFSFEERLDGLGAQLLSCVRDAHCALRSWRLPDVNDGCMRSSLATEMRALERARAGVLRAQQMGAQLPPRDALRLQLDCFRRAAWPAAVELHGSSVHARVLERIGSGELVDLEQAISGVRGKAVPGVGSLDQFRSPESATGSTPLRSSSSASTPSLESSWSSSVGSQEGVYAEGPDLQLLARAMNGPLISEANVVVCTGARSTLRSICTRGGTG